jgi:hypothetical protein
MNEGKLGSRSRGINTVRAYLYLRAIRAGASVVEANELAQGDVLNGEPQTIRDAKLCVQTLYGGKQLPLIAEATREGLVL